MSIRQKPTHYCDLCDEERDPADLRRVRSERLYATQSGFKSVGLDVCTSCQDRPIKELIAAFDRETRRQD